MTGLFDALNTRFAPSGSPAIRARPVSRFEGEPGGNLVEEEAREIADRPDAPRSERQVPGAEPAVRAETPQEVPGFTGEATKLATERDQVAPMDSPTELDEGAEPAVAPADSLPEVTASVVPEPIEGAPEEKVVEAEGPVPEVAIDRSGPIREVSAPVNDAPETKPVETPPTEIVTTVRTPPERAEPEAPRADIDPDPPTPTIRIGRIEVRQPVKQQAPPAPQPTPRRDPPATRRVAQTKTGSKGRLTDYLGWKA